MEEREGYLTRNGWSGLGLEIERRQGRESKEMIENLKRRDIERQGQAQYEKIQRSRYNERYKWIATVGIPEYLSKSGNGESQQLIAQARCGSLERWNRYWEEEERRKCDICEEAPGTMEHLTRECRKVNSEISIEEVLSGRKDEKAEKWLSTIKIERQIERKKQAIEKNKTKD
ncbi:hypothetical protein WH47_10526 [Habropoda laboriosa]|uniref:Uncharacterized protein n=1 Tax=Habropoda laboriosa TaxID=597456 RepID=A0A0L7QMR7_9HYME|nr:hypothetical protein WH47_10526 [Habropoda laboriosa]